MVNVCVIGAGRVGVLHTTNIMKRVPKARVVGIVDKNTDLAKKVADEYGIRCFSSVEEVGEDPNVHAVVITTPTFTHHDIAVYFMERKKHVFCEKPLAITLEEAFNIKKICEKNKVKFQIGFMRRFDPAFREAKEIIENGLLGDIMSIRSITRGPGLPPEWAWDVKKSNGFLAEVNSHDFDSVRWLCGSEFEEVFAYGKVRKAIEIAEKYPDFYDTAIVNFVLKNDVIGVIEGSCPVEYGYDARVEILGTKGLLTIGDVQNFQSVLFCETTKRAIRKTVGSWPERFKEAYVLEIESFIDSILNDEEPSPGISDGIEAMKAVLAANKSIQEGRPVRIEEVG